MNICMYGASSTDLDKIYYDAAEHLGRRIAARGHGLVFGGGAQGLMGATARGLAAGGGRITGIAAFSQGCRGGRRSGQERKHLCCGCPAAGLRLSAIPENRQAGVSR